MKEWIQKGRAIRVDFPDRTEKIIDRIIEEQLYAAHHHPSIQTLFGYPNSSK